MLLSLTFSSLVALANLGRCIPVATRADRRPTNLLLNRIVCGWAQSPARRGRWIIHLRSLTGGMREMRGTNTRLELYVCLCLPSMHSHRSCVFLIPRDRVLEIPADRSCAFSRQASILPTRSINHTVGTAYGYQSLIHIPRCLTTFESFPSGTSSRE